MLVKGIRITDVLYHEAISVRINLIHCAIYSFRNRLLANVDLKLFLPWCIHATPALNELRCTQQRKYHSFSWVQQLQIPDCPGQLKLLMVNKISSPRLPEGQVENYIYKKYQYLSFFCLISDKGKLFEGNNMNLMVRLPIGWEDFQDVVKHVVINLLDEAWLAASQH